MIKRIILFVVVVAILFSVGLFLNTYLTTDYELSFSLVKLYAFNAIASILIYVLVELVIDNLPNETGYLYLGLMMVKFGVFILMFQKSIFSEEGLTKPEKISILIPVFTFLILETLSVSKLLNSK
ncbi:MAG: DUF6168 family protein [Tenacibaculum sp.]